MTIFGLIQRNSGPGFHRIHVPLEFMNGPDCYITNAATEADFEKRKPDWIYYNRMIGDEILKLQPKYQFRIAVDVDDYWELDPHHILYDTHYTLRNNEVQMRHIELADVVTCTHERLADKIYKLNKNVHVVPNAIPKNCPYFPVAHEHCEDMFRVFWQGSITHEKDIELMRGPVRRLDKKKFAMVMAGVVIEHEVWQRMVSSYTNGIMMKGVLLPGRPVNEYYYSYRFADVCVCPLIDSTFNSMKSNLKILEAAHSGLPVIASHVNPYLGMDGVMYVRNQKDWYRHLNNFEFWQSHANVLKDYCDRHYNFEYINNNRKQIFYS